MRNNGKDKFYRTLNFDKVEWGALKFYKELKKEIEKDKEEQEDQNEN